MERFRRNTISSIKTNSGDIITDHQEMAGTFWADFKNRMGRSDGISMGFDLPCLLHRVDGLEELSLPFSDAEVDEVIKFMPGDRALGPDGFNRLFLKKCWPILREDFMKLVKEFYDGNCDLECINSSLITLIPKKLSPEVVGDYMPISLTNTCLKFLTKLLANRLQKVILKCIHNNQYGFLKSRSIQDCLAWCFKYIHQCKASGRPIVLLKLDFTKAFDIIEHQAIMQILKLKGFDDCWLRWIQALLSSGSSSILLNGVPGNHFMCKCGVRQGDPMSFYSCSLLICCNRLLMICAPEVFYLCLSLQTVRTIL